MRAGRVTGVTPATGSLARIDRVSQYVAIMPNPPRKTAGYAFTLSISVIVPPAPVHARPRGDHHGEQEDRVEDEPARLPGGERGERGPAGGGSGPGRARAPRS